MISLENIKVTLAICGHSKCNKRVEGLENHRRLDHAIIVEFAQVLDTADTPLVVLRVIHL